MQWSSASKAGLEKIAACGGKLGVVKESHFFSRTSSLATWQPLCSNMLAQCGVALYMRVQGWREVPMHNTPSRSRPKGGVWKVAVISAEQQQQQGGGGLEFYVTNGDGTREDRPAGGGSYRCRAVFTNICRQQSCQQGSSGIC